MLKGLLVITKHEELVGGGEFRLVVDSVLIEKEGYIWKIFRILTVNDALKMEILSRAVSIMCV